ncbi:hypothetical protein HDK90DRAFT_77363 [Phyllosticta capitalensis]|uniref:Uncharacterized protein n=1 Tax=Phyllosticta capitalensis TaxID=121624 RepID=A0ABR1YD67_9PEZI
MKSVLLLMTITSGARASVLSPTSREILLSRQLSLIGPSEIPVGTPPQGPAHSLLDHHSSPFEDESALSGEGRDFSRIKEIATAVCLHRGLEPERVLPKLVAFFDNADEQIDEDKTEQRPRVSAEKQDTNATRPPSWAPGDDAAIQGEARSSTEFWHDGDRPRRPTQTSELSQPRRGSVTSDLSISSSEETGQEEEHTKQPLIKTKTKIPSPCPEVGSGAHRRQADGSSGHLVGSPTTMSRPGSGSSDKVVLSSSVSSHRTAFRRSSDRLDYYGSGGAASTRTAERHANQSAQKTMAGSRPASKSLSGGTHHPPAAAAAQGPAAAGASDMSKSKARASMQVAPWTIGSGGGQDATAVTKQRLNVKENEAGTTTRVGASDRGTGATAAVGYGEKKNGERAEGDRDVGRKASQVRNSRRMHQQLHQQQQQQEEHRRREK